MPENPSTTWRRWVIGSVLVALVMLAVLAARGLYNHYVPESGRRHLEVMRSDPILAFRAPGTDLREQREQQGRIHWFDGHYDPPSVRQTFELTSEPDETVEAYRQAAQEAGWTFLADKCSRAELATGVVFGRTFRDFRVTLRVRAQLRDVLGNQVTGASPGGVLEVWLDEDPAGQLWAPSTPRAEVHCLKDLDLSDPDLLRPELREMSPQDICAMVPVTAARAISADIVGVKGYEARTECWWVDHAGTPLFRVTQAPEARIHYDDQRLPGAGTSDELFYFSYGPSGTDDERAVWVAAPGGPFVVAPGGALAGAQTSEDEPLLAFARLLADAE